MVECYFLLIISSISLFPKGEIKMGLVIIFGLAAILGIFAMISAFKNKNFLGVLFAFGTAAVFGWFSVMTVLNNGYPTGH
jgi:hypothetical protein